MLVWGRSGDMHQGILAAERRLFPEEHTLGTPALIAIGVLVIRFSNLEPHLSRFYGAIANIGVQEAEKIFLRNPPEVQYSLLIDAIDLANLGGDKSRIAKNICDRYNYISKKINRFTHNHYMAIHKIDKVEVYIENITVNSKDGSIGNWISNNFGIKILYETIDEVQKLSNDLFNFILKATQNLSEEFPRRTSL